MLYTCLIATTFLATRIAPQVFSTAFKPSVEVEFLASKGVSVRNIEITLEIRQNGSLDINANMDFQCKALESSLLWKLFPKESGPAQYLGSMLIDGYQFTMPNGSVLTSIKAPAMYRDFFGGRPPMNEPGESRYYVFLIGEMLSEHRKTFLNEVRNAGFEANESDIIVVGRFELGGKVEEVAKQTGDKLFLSLSLEGTSNADSGLTLEVITPSNTDILYNSEGFSKMKPNTAIGVFNIATDLFSRFIYVEFKAINPLELFPTRDILFTLLGVALGYLLPRMEKLWNQVRRMTIKAKQKFHSWTKA